VAAGGTATQIRGQGLSSAQLYTAYRALLDTYVDPVDDTQLIKAATDTLRQGLQSQPNLPLLTLPLQMLPVATGNAEKDWQAFGAAYDSVTNKLPTWSQQTHPDWMVLRAMADSLKDGHTSFMTPDEARRRNETSFAGIGVLMSRPQDNQPPLIAEIFPSSPASSSGLKRGDRIIGVDGQDVLGKAVSDIAQLIRGQPGTQVRVQVRRLNSDQPLEFAMRRALVQVDQVIGRQVPNVPIGYLKIRSFGDLTMVEQVLGILDQGKARGIRGWVVDLRSNPGGALTAVLGSAAGFFDASHTIVGYQVDRLRHQTPLEITQPTNNLNGAPLIVLVDRDSASGAEIFAAAIQEAKIGTLVGSKTAGNVGVATQVSLADGSLLQVTEQRFVTPGGAQIDGVGVTPDVVVDMTDEDLQNDRDPQLGKALELIVEKMTAPQG
jgi:carboxyl-terminal processing protease